MDSLSSVRLALSSVTMPMPVLMMMTNPNTASFQEPVISTSTIAAKMMPLNSVNTLARTMSRTERDVEVFTAFDWPLSIRCTTSLEVRPVAPISGISTAVVALIFPSLPRLVPQSAKAQG